MAATTPVPKASRSYTPARTVDIGYGPHAHVAFARSTNTIWAVNNEVGTITVLDATTAEPIRKVVIGGTPTHIIIDDDRGQAFIPTREDWLVILSLTSMEVVAQTPLPEGTSPTVLVPQQDLGRIYVLGNNGTLCVVGLGDFSLMKILEVGEKPSWGQPHKSSCGKSHVTNFGSDTVSVIDDKSIEVVATIPVGKGPNRNAIYREREAMYSANLGDHTLTGISVVDNSVLGTAKLGIDPFRLVPAEKKTGRPEIWVLGRGDNRSPGGLEIVDATTHTVSHRLDTVAHPANWLFDGPIGHIVATNDRELAIVDTRSIAVIGTIRLEHDPDLDCTSNMVMNDSGDLFLVNSDDTITQLHASA